ncbi:MAG: hypothetical protein ACKOSS_11515 [Planctomycetia bacterium]
MSTAAAPVLGLWLDAHPGAAARRAFLRTLVAARAAGRTTWLLDLRGARTPLAEGLGDEEQRWLEALDTPAPVLGDALEAAGSLLVLAGTTRPGTPAVLQVDDAWLAHTPRDRQAGLLAAAGQVVRAR